MKMSHNYLGRYPFILNERFTNISANIEQAYRNQEERKKCKVSVGVGVPVLCTLREAAASSGSDLISDICKEFESNSRNVTGNGQPPAPSTREKQDQDYMR